MPKQTSVFNIPLFWQFEKKKEKLLTRTIITVECVVAQHLLQHCDGK